MDYHNDIWITLYSVGTKKNISQPRISHPPSHSICHQGPASTGFIQTMLRVSRCAENLIGEEMCILFSNVSMEKAQLSRT